MTEVQFVEIKPFLSCCKDLDVVYHIPSTIKASNKHYIALCEVNDSSQLQFTWVWAGKTVPLEQEGITVKWRKGKVTFTNQVLPKLSDGREYYLMYCNEDGTILGESRAFQFFTESDEFSSIDLQSAPSDDVVMISMHRKKAPPTTSSEISSLHSNDDTMSFEVLPEQRYSDTVAGEKQECFTNSVTSTVIPKGDNASTESTTANEGNSTKSDDELLTASYKETTYQNVDSNASQINIQQLEHKVATLEEKILRLGDELAQKCNVIEELLAENTTLREQSASNNTLSNSMVLINSPKEDREKRILKKRVQDEAKKSTRLEELLDHKEQKALKMEKQISELIAKVKEAEQALHASETESKRAIDQVHALQKVPQDDTATRIENERLLRELQRLQTELLAKQHIEPKIELPNKKATAEELANLNISVGAEYKTKLYLKLFRQDPFICHVCNEVLPAHTQEFTRLNHVEHCKGPL